MLTFPEKPPLTIEEMALAIGDHVFRVIHGEHDKVRWDDRIGDYSLGNLVWHYGQERYRAGVNPMEEPAAPTVNSNGR